MAERCVSVSAAEASVCIRGAELLRGVTFDCCEGEWTLLRGPSGAGKSTLLRLLNGLCTPSSGRVSTLGSLLPGRSRREAMSVWRQCGTVLQEVALFETRTARQNVALPLRASGVDRRSAGERAEEWLERLGLGDKADEFPCHLSGGQRQRVALARAFAGQPRVLFLDEPTSALDRGNAEHVLALLRGFVEQGATVVMAGHGVEHLADCSRIIDLEDGRIAGIHSREAARTR